MSAPVSVAVSPHEPAGAELAPGAGTDEVEAPSRLAWADVARGVGIALVVFGHVLRGLFGAELLENAGVWGYVDRFVYAFHMPLFLFLSGLFLGTRPNESFGELALERLRRLAYPYLVWASLQMAIQTLMSRFTNSPASLSDLWTIAYEPPMQFWFLYALLLQSLWLGLLDKWAVPRAASLALAFAMYALAPGMLLGWGVLHQARFYLPYTALGFYLGAQRTGAWLARPARELVAICVLGFGVAGVAARSAAWQGDRFVALAVASIGTLAALALCAALCSARSEAARRVAQVLALWGRASLAIFVAHTIASAGVRIVLQRVLHVDDVTIHVVLGTALGVLAPLLLWRLSTRLGWALFEWPERRAR